MLLPVQRCALQCTRRREYSAMELLTIVEVARLCKLSTRAIYNLVARRAMPTPIKIGAATRWRRADIEAWLAAGCPADESEVPA